MRIRHLSTELILAALFALLSVQSWAAPRVQFTADNLGGGFFQYNLTVDNRDGTVDFSGLLIINGNSVFGLGDTSVIGAPQDVGGDPLADWSYFPPVPTLVDILFYTSLDPSADIPAGGLLGGFFFQSNKDPSTVQGNDFAVEAIDAQFGSEIVLGNAIPEPCGPVLFAFGFLAMIRFASSRNSASSQRTVRRFSPLERNSDAIAARSFPLTFGGGGAYDNQRVPDSIDAVLTT